MVTTCSFAYKILWFKRPINIKTAVGWAESLISYQAAPTGVAIFNVDNDSNIDVVTGENGGGQIHWYERSSSSWTIIFFLVFPRKDR